MSTVKADGDLARYFPNILPATRQEIVRICHLEYKSEYAKDTQDS